MSSNLLTYRNVFINESTYSNNFNVIKNYDSIDLNITNLVDKDEYIQINFVNEYFLDITGIKLLYDGSSSFRNIEIYYSVDGLNLIEMTDYYLDEFTNEYFFNESIKCKFIKVLFVATQDLILNNIEIYENIIINNYDKIIKEYKIKELKDVPDFLKGKNLGTIVSDFMNIIVEKNE